MKRAALYLQAFAGLLLAAYPQRPYPAADEPVALTPEFIVKAREIAGQRVTLAGYRLGNLLNEIFADTARP